MVIIYNHELLFEERAAEMKIALDRFLIKEFGTKNLLVRH